MGALDPRRGGTTDSGRENQSPHHTKGFHPSRSDRRRNRRKKSRRRESNFVEEYAQHRALRRSDPRSASHSNLLNRHDCPGLQRKDDW